ncbi:MAG: preprotein translocase subunit SecG [Paracoccaceae bacterium]|jgi:preprotein translocase subunit SecG|nr:preprotein translocase subunit SecG [Paracoccaceae bacterium]
MANVILIVHLLLALSLIAVVLLQRSEGGGLGMGGGGGVMSGRPPGTPLGKVTWALAIAFIATSMALTILAAAGGDGASVVDRLQPAPSGDVDTPALPSGEDLLPPSVDGALDAPLVPQAAE